jgi:predicted ATPase
MRLDRVYIDGFKNLKDVEADFDQRRLTTVIIGENGTGKSNLLEAIVDIFRFIDLDRGKPRYRFEIDYRIDDRSVRVTNLTGQPRIFVDGKPLTRSAFERDKSRFFPDLVFGYYSGGGRRLETLFDSHQRRYYDAIKINDNVEECRRAYVERRLFYCRPIHGVFALLSSFAFPEGGVAELLKAKVGITGFHSALALFKEPWFAKGGAAAKLAAAGDFWGAKGPAGVCARAIRGEAFHPLSLEGNGIDDYRDKQQKEAQFACYLRDASSLLRLAQTYSNDQELFFALEAADISDLFRQLHVWVTRTNDDIDDVSFSDLSDGERQLLMVLGLIRASRGKRSLFLLDEPDTHLNPLWQLSYLELIRDWTGIAANPDNCQVVLTSHNPLTIAALERDEVRVMNLDKEGRVSIKAPFVDPRGLGFAGVLTDIFGMSSTLDRPTQKLVDERNRLARLGEPSDDELRRLEDVNHELRALGFLYEERDQLYGQFLRKLNKVELADVAPLTPEELQRREETTEEIVQELLNEQ